MRRDASAVRLPKQRVIAASFLPRIFGQSSPPTSLPCSATCLYIVVLALGCLRHSFYIPHSGDIKSLFDDHWLAHVLNA